MTNKALAYDFVDTWLHRNHEVIQLIPEHEGLTDEDKSQLLQLLNTLQQHALDAGKYHQMASEQQAQMTDAVNKMALENMRNTYDTIIGIKSALSEVITDARRAYRYVLWMYTAAFVLGFVLIAVAIVFAALGKTILAIAFGAIGLIDLVVYFIYKPPLEIQNSRSNLIQLMLVLTNWFADMMNLNTYMSHHLADLSLADLGDISEKQNANTEKMVALIEKYGERHEK